MQIDLQLILDIYSIFVITIGITFNLVNLFLFSRKRLAQISVSVPVRLLTINILMNLVSFGSMNLPFFNNIELLQINYCKISNTISVILNAINSWILVFMPIDRLIMIIFPKKPKFLTTKKFQMSIFFLIHIYNIVIYLPLFINSYKAESIIYNKTKQNR